MATLDGIEIKTAIRYGHNGHKYVWENITQEKLDYLVQKYGCDEIEEKHGIAWLIW